MKTFILLIFCTIAFANDLENLAKDYIELVSKNIIIKKNDTHKVTKVFNSQYHEVYLVNTKYTISRANLSSLQKEVKGKIIGFSKINFKQFILVNKH